ncbi:MAG: PD-(D/E)XK nuclease family protein [Gammaproteobacteria bacterium]|nr:PD-(D/E)XK nuclease family protein [Gammaproteobacteria bacterium]
MTKKESAEETGVVEQQTASRSDIFDALKRGATVVTGNKRLATDVRETFEYAMAAAGLEAWPTPHVIPWPAWLQSVWEEVMVSGVLPDSGVLLTPHQEQRVWEDIITYSMSREPLQQVSGTVRLVQEAWRLVHSWQLPLTGDEFLYNRDSTAFSGWAAAFESRCRDEGWIPADHLADRIRDCAEARAPAGPEELVLIGFDILTPQQQSLLQAMLASGCTVRWLRPANRGSRAARVACADVRHEAASMARWVRTRLEEDPAVRIGVVVPEFTAKRDLVIHALDEVLVPQVVRPGSYSTARPYNLSLGIPLSRYPAISTALRLLGLLEPVIPLEEACRLLRSPFIAGWEQEASARAMLDGRLREACEPDVELKTLRYHASQTGKPHACPVLVERLDVWTRAAWDCPRTDRPGQWSRRFTGLLDAIGWPQGRSLSSEEYQSIEAWRELLSAFAALDPVTGPMSAAAALACLRRMSGERTFQPRTGIVPVQVLGVVQSSWLQFDCLWVMGLHDGIWPASPRPNPFVPLPLQRKSGLPHSSEALELQAAQAVTGRMLAGAPEVVVSHPQRNADETLRPSPLIAHLPVADPEFLQLWPAPAWRDAVHASARLTGLEEVPVPLQDCARARGGSAVFKLQAACPFRAFAELRLGARALRQAALGLNAMTRGLLVHRILEKVWGELDSSGQLAAMDAGRLGDLVHRMVDEAITEIARRHPRSFHGSFREIESERLCGQVLEWLEQEKKRAPFRVVEREGEHEATVGGIRVRLKIDRMDELEDGRRVVIDYKTGAVSASQWFGERPDEPQLPLYSIAVEGDLAGLLFAQVKAGTMAFRGVVEGKGLIAGVKSWEQLAGTRDAGSWQEVLQRWRATMDRLGEAYHAGHARVDPKHHPATCTHCTLGPLCRIHELNSPGSEAHGPEAPHE